MEQENAKKWFKKCIGCLGAVVLLMIIIVYVFDPYFHFHKPYDFVKYRLYDERYTNDGINRHFEYDAIVTGTSMSQNFKPSEIDALFGTTSIKQSFSGAGYMELSQNLERALQRNEDLKTIIWTMDYNALIRPADWSAYDDYPTYLYDDYIWNDVSYIFNKSMWYHGVLANLMKTITNEPSTTFDEYSAWEKETGLEYILRSYDRNDIDLELPSELTEDEAQMVYENVKTNMVNLANQYPDTTFYIFYSPYSICYWDELNLSDTLVRQLQAEQIATELLLECPNVKLYNFFEQYDVITDVNNYRDKEHYASWINSQILEWMLEDVGLVTKDNYQERLAREYAYYSSYDYDSIYE